MTKQSNEKTKTKRSFKQKTLRFLCNATISMFLLSEAALLGAGVYGGNFILKNLSEARSVNASELTQNPNSEIYASDGKTLIWTNSKYQHRHLSLSDTPEVMIDLLTSTEDKDFWKNDGYSVTGFAHALSGKRGGSTITQQLVKNMRFVGKNISDKDRKIQEIAIAINLTKRFSKKQILEAYLNKIGFLESSYGFDTAMYLLYGKDIKKDATSDLDIAQYATIVGMLQNPTMFNPRLHPKASQNRRNQVLRNAYDNDKISKQRYEAAKKIPIEEGLKEQGWFTQQVYVTSSEHGSYVDSILRQLKKLGYDYESTSNPIKVVSNLNVNENKWLQETASNPAFYQDDKQQVAIAVTEPKTGNVLAQVGSRNGGPATDLNRAVQTTRSSGSTIKPFLDYAPLIEFAGYSSNSIWQANQTSYAGTNVIVRNYGGYTYGNVTTQFALKMSLNVPAVLALETQQPWMNQVVMSRLGLQNHFMNSDGSMSEVSTFGGSDALGINESVVDFASAFSALANNGVHKTPNYLKTVEQSGTVSEIKPDEQVAMSPSTAYQLLSMLKTTMERDGSAKSAAIPELKGYSTKTGTVAYDANAVIYADEEHTRAVGYAGNVIPGLAASDSWLAGTTKSASVAVWTGYDDQSVYGRWINEQTTTRSDIYTEVMKHFNQGKDSSDWTPTTQKVDMNVKNEDRSIDLISNNDLNKLKSLLQSKMKVQDFVKNDVHADKSQTEFAKKYDENKLDNQYQSMKQYFELNDSFTPALKKAEMSESTKIYSIDQNGRVVKK